MKTAYCYCLLLTALLLLTGCSESEALYGKPDDTPGELQLSATVSEENVIEFKFDGSNTPSIPPIVFSWTPAAERGEAIKYLFRMDIATDEDGTTVKREELGEHVYEKILEASQLYYYLREDWKVTPDHGTVFVDVAVVGTVQTSDYMRPESSTIRIAVKLTR